MFGYIYKITNLINGKVYIGQHKGEFDSTYWGGGKNISQAIKKYGQRKFICELIQYADSRLELDTLEKHFISECRKHLLPEDIYNICDGGLYGNQWKAGNKSWNTGKKMSQEIRHNMSKSRTGRAYSEAARIARSKAIKTAWEKGLFSNRKRNPHSEETKNKIGLKHKGKIISDAHKEILRKSALKQWEEKRKVAVL